MHTRNRYPDPMTSDAVRCFLVSDGALQLHVASPYGPIVERWLPHPFPTPPQASQRNQACIRVEGGAERGMEKAIEVQEEAILVQLGSVHGWWNGTRCSELTLRGRNGTFGSVDLEECSSVIVVPDGRISSGVEWDVYYMLTLSAALLLCRLNRALVHAGAVVGPDGGAWLLVGDTRAGKTTTVATLIREGWNFLSDDQVILSASGCAGSPAVEGWLRPFHLDAGWATAEPDGIRFDVDPGDVGPGRPQARAPLHGLLFPDVAADSPTALRPLSGADALSSMIRQSPWLFLDRSSASDVLDLMTAAATLPSFGLRLGRDSFSHGKRLREVLAPAFQGSASIQ